MLAHILRQSAAWGPLSARPLAVSQSATMLSARSFVTSLLSRQQTAVPKLWVIPGKQSRFASQKTYRTFNNRRSVSSLWATSGSFRQGTYAVLGLGGAFVAFNIERVPGSNRLRFNFVSPELEARFATGQYEQMRAQFSGALLPQPAAEVRRVRRVLERLLPHAGVDYGAPESWTVDVVASDQANAFVMPGGHVFVFTGILPICVDDSALATVLGHEIAHATAHHAAEQMSRYAVLLVAALAFSAVFDLSNQLSWYVLDLALNKPGSRAQEAEADHLGLLMMARSCFDPRRALDFWQEMQRQESKMAQPPQWLSTHPSHGRRVKAIQGWMDQALEARTGSNCAVLGGFADQFRQKTKKSAWEETW